MERRELKTELITLQVTKKAYLPFIENERVVDATIKEKNVDAKFSVVEDFTEIGSIKDTSENSILSLGNVKTACLVVEVNKPTDVEVLILK